MDYWQTIKFIKHLSRDLFGIKDPQSAEAAKELRAAEDNLYNIYEKNNWIFDADRYVPQKEDS